MNGNSQHLQARPLQFHIPRKESFFPPNNSRIKQWRVSLVAALRSFNHPEPIVVTSRRIIFLKHSTNLIISHSTAFHIFPLLSE